MSDPALEQRRDAIRKANRVRIAKSHLKKQLRAGKVSPAKVLNGDGPKSGEALQTEEFLLAVPGIGKWKVGKLLDGLYIGRDQRLRELTQRQRHVLAERLEGK